MSADSPRRSSGSRGIFVPAVVPPQVVVDRSILDSAIGFINDVTLANQPHTKEPKDTITWARFETAADISDPRFGEDWELEGNVAPPLLLILGYGLGVQVWAIPANGEAVEVLSWRHGVVTTLRVLPTPASSAAIEENGRADEPVDAYGEKRPLIAVVDGSTSVGGQPQFSAVNFVSLKTGTQVKAIKFKNPVLDILANRSSIVITFNERIAVFDARTLDDRLSITTCYPSPGINPNPVALGQRWLAYAEHKLIPSKRSAAGCDGEGVASYTATVLNAAKSFGKGLRELGEQVAAGLTGTTGGGGMSKNNSFDSNIGGDAKQPGVVTILDIKYPIRDYSPTSGAPMTGPAGSDPIVAHFIAHSEAIVGMEFDNSGMLLLTADRRGHDFHIFRIHPHPVGSSLAAVQHLYVLHRGDTSAKVQNITFSLDSRWVAVSTLRGTTHVFPITPYGGPMGVRTHTSMHVVNKLSRFHRSAGLSAEGRSSSPISHSESTNFMQSLQPFHNPTLPPFSRPTVVLPLTQLRQPFVLGSPPGSATLAMAGKSGSGGGSGSSQRQRHSSLSDDNGKPLSVCAIFAKSRSWLLDPPNATREAPHRIQRKAVDSLFVMAGHGALIQYDLDTKLASNVAKEKICDDTPIELEVEAKAQWNLGRRKDGSHEIMPPLSTDNWLLKNRNSCMLTDSTRQYDDSDDRTESWLSQVEIITHAGPHRRLWMGPQFVFKTYNTPSGSNLSHVDVEAVEIGVTKPATAAAAARAERSSPLNMPLSAASRSTVPVLIESGSYSSIEQSPKLMDRFRHGHLDSDFAVAHGDTRLKEDLADAMRESPTVSAAHKDTGRLLHEAASSENVPFYDALAEHEHDGDDDDYESGFESHRSSSAVALASVLPNISSYDTSASLESLESLKKTKASIEKVVNPLGTVTTVTKGMTAAVKTDMLDEVVLQLAAEECVIHENCDEALFRPVVAIFCDENARKRGEEEAEKTKDLRKPPELVGNKLIVPVIAKEVDAELSKKEKQKSDARALQRREQKSSKDEQSKFEEFSSLNKKSKPQEDVASRNAIIATDRKPAHDDSVDENKPTPARRVIPKQEDRPGVARRVNVVEQCEPNHQSCSAKHDEVKATKSTITRTLPAEKSTKQTADDGAKETTAASSNNSSNSEATNKFQTSMESKAKEDIKKAESTSTTDKIVEKAQVRTELLNVSHLTDSLKELDDYEEASRDEECGALKNKKSTCNTPPSDFVKLQEPIDIYEVRSTATKKTKGRQSSSGSASETEETVTISTNNRRRERVEAKKKLSDSSDEGNTLVERCKVKEKTLASPAETQTKAQKSIKPEDGVKNIPTKSESTAEEKDTGRTVTGSTTVVEIDAESREAKSVRKTEDKIKEQAAIERTEVGKLEEENDTGTREKEQTRNAAIKETSKNESIKTTLDSKTEPENSRIGKAASHLKEKLDDVKVDSKVTPKSAKKNMTDSLKTEAAALPPPSERKMKKASSDSKLEAVNVTVEQPTKSIKKAKGKKGQNMKSMSSEDVTDFPSISNKCSKEELVFSFTSKTPKETTDSAPDGSKPKNILAQPVPAVTSAWKTLSGAEMITKSIETTKTRVVEPSNKFFPESTNPFRSSTDLEEAADNTKSFKSSKKSTPSGFEEFSLFKPLESLPPLPALEPLELIGGAVDRTREARPVPVRDLKDSLVEHMSLINFESPLQDNPAIEKKITSPNLIFALCGSLHYENESGTKLTAEKVDADASLSLTRSSSALADYKSLPENDDQYMSLEQSSQDTNTTNTGYTNEKYSSSCNSSASEEIIVLEEKKMSKKQRRKKQQMVLQRQRAQLTSNAAAEVDEELRPLIGMSDSQMDNYSDNNMVTGEIFSTSLSAAPSTTLLMDDTHYTLRATASSSQLYSTTTDSEGPMPATTSDDNVFTLPASSLSTPNKLKTKKLEHKINLIAAIEAATSSSTSSAEESGVEAGGGRSPDIDAGLISIVTPAHQLSKSTSSAVQQGVTKKKTKRRKR